MSDQNLSIALAPPAELNASLGKMSTASAGLYQLVNRFGNSSDIEQLSPQVQALFLNNYQPFARVMGAQGQQLIYQITDVTTDIIKLGWAIQSLSNFLNDHLQHYKDNGFHLFLHFRTKRRFEQALSDVDLAISSSKTLKAAVEAYHTEINQYVAQINQELTELAQGPGFLQSEFNSVIGQLDQVGDADALNGRMATLVMNMYRVYNQQAYENSSYFKAFLQQKIQAVLNEYKNQAVAIVDSLTGIGSFWNLLKDDLSSVLADLKKLQHVYPKAITILTKVDLKILTRKWQDVHDELTRMESSIISSSPN